MMYILVHIFEGGSFTNDPCKSCKKDTVYIYKPTPSQTTDTASKSNDKDFESLYKEMEYKLSDKDIMPGQIWKYEYPDPFEHRTPYTMRVLAVKNGYIDFISSDCNCERSLNVLLFKADSHRIK